MPDLSELIARHETLYLSTDPATGNYHIYLKEGGEPVQDEINALDKDLHNFCQSTHYKWSVGANGRSIVLTSRDENKAFNRRLTFSRVRERFEKLDLPQAFDFHATFPCITLRGLVISLSEVTDYHTFIKAIVASFPVIFTSSYLTLTYKCIDENTIGKIQSYAGHHLDLISVSCGNKVIDENNYRELIQKLDAYAVWLSDLIKGYKGSIYNHAKNPNSWFTPNLDDVESGPATESKLGP